MLHVCVLEPGRKLKEGKNIQNTRQVTRSLATRTDTLPGLPNEKGKEEARSSNIELGASRVEVVVKSRLPMQETPKSGAQSQGQVDPLKEGRATLSRILA